MIRAGWGTFSMKSQKDLQDYFHEQIWMMRKVDEFPPFWNFGGSLGFKTSQRSAVGFWGEYTSTGGRLHYRDYSGEASVIQSLKAFQVGMFYQLQLNQSQAWPIFFTTHGSVVSSRMDIETSVFIGSSGSEDQEAFKSINLALRPGLMIQRRVKEFLFQAGIGGELQTHGSMRSYDGSIDNLVLPDGQEVTAEWDGFRAFIAVGARLSD